MSYINTKSAEDLAQEALNMASQSQSVSNNAVTSSNSSKPMSSDTSESLTSLQNVIERNALALDEMNLKLRELRESLKNVFDNDTQLSVVQQDAEKVASEVKNRRSQLQAGPQVMQMKSKISEVSEQKKEVEEALNNHLLNLYKITGTKVVDLSSGEREFSIKASLKSSKSAG